MPLPLILGTAMKFAPAIGSILGLAGKSRGEAQTTNEALGIQRANADINRRRYMLEAPGERTRQSARASMVQNQKPTSIKLGMPGYGMRGETPKFEGGFSNPDMYSPDARQVAGNAVKQHLVAQMRGDDKVPELPAIGRSSVLDKILGAAGFGTNILGAISKARGPSAAPRIDTPFLDM